MDVRGSFTAKQKDRITSFLMLNVSEGKILQYDFLQGHNVWENNPNLMSTQRNLVIILVTKPEFLVPTKMFLPFEIVSAGLHWDRRISRQILPLLFMLGWYIFVVNETWNKIKRNNQHVDGIHMELSTANVHKLTQHAHLH